MIGPRNAPTTSQPCLATEEEPLGFYQALLDYRKESVQGEKSTDKGLPTTLRSRPGTPFKPRLCRLCSGGWGGDRDLGRQLWPLYKLCYYRWVVPSYLLVFQVFVIFENSIRQTLSSTRRKVLRVAR